MAALTEYIDVDDVYIAEYGNHCIRKVVSSTSIISTVAGTGTGGYSGDNGAATSAALNAPVGIAVDTSGKHLTFYGFNLSFILSLFR